MKTENLYVGIDLGGTSIKMAFITQDGLILNKWDTPTNTTDNGINIPSEIICSIQYQMERASISMDQIIGIGIGAPAFLEMNTGFVYHAVNIGWRNFPLKETLEKLSGLPVFVDNDANAAALGEMWKGSGEGSQTIIFVTLGTGVGGGIIINGEIVHGTNGMAGEIGHIMVEPGGGAPCNCGKSGCLETVASATGLVRITKEQIDHNQASILYKKKEFLTSMDIFSAAEQGDDFAISMIDRMGFYLGSVLSNLSNALNPEKIIIGGGVSKAGELLLNPIRHYFSTYALPRVNEGAKIVRASLGNDAGMIGAAWLVKSKQIQL